MAIYDGVVNLADDDIPVLVELGEHHVRMTAGGTEVGDWTTDECLISNVGDTVFTISAENETLQFVPNQPNLFAAALNGADQIAQPAARVVPPPIPREAPTPGPITMGLFYGLCGVTAALALWSLLTIIF